MKLFTAALILFVFSSCATTQNPIPSDKVYDTSLGFKVKPPPNGPWYWLESADRTGYILGKHKSKQDVEDGSTVIAEVRYGYINVEEMKLKNSKQILKTFEADMVTKEANGRFERTKNHFAPTKFKDADCSRYEQIAEIDKITKSKKGEAMSMSTRGLLCLHPLDKSRYIRLMISQRVPISRPFADFKDDESQFFEDLEFTAVPGPSPYQ